MLLQTGTITGFLVIMDKDWTEHTESLQQKEREQIY